MRLLIYVEPLPEKRPLWKRGWLTAVERMVTALQNDDPAEDEIWIVTAEALAREATARFPSCRVVSVAARELIPALGPSANHLATGWYEGTASTHTRSAMAALLKSKLTSFSPEVCISFSPAPFLKDLFPEITVLHFEYGMISRAPFPETAYLDPFGMYRQGALTQFANQIRAFQPSARERDLLDDVRSTVGARMLGPANPLREVVAPRLEGFKASLLVALQFSDFFAYDCHAQISQQSELLRHVLDHTPPDIAVIANEHPENRVLDRETLDYFRARYRNFIWEPEFRATYASGQYLVDFADAVVTVSSSVGLQTLLWRKKLIVLGNSHLDIAADSHELAAVQDVLASPLPDCREATAAWLLNRYYHPYDTLFEPRNFRELLDRANPADIAAEGFNWFQPVERSRRIARAYADAAKQWASHFTAPAEDAALVSVVLYTARAQAPFAEATALRRTLRLDPEPSVVTFDIPPTDQHLTGFQFSFPERTSKILVFGMEATGVEGDVLWRWDGAPDAINRGTGIVATEVPDLGACLLEIVNEGAHIAIPLPPTCQANAGTVTLRLAAADPVMVERLRLASLARATRHGDVLAAVNRAQAQVQATVEARATQTAQAFGQSQDGLKQALLAAQTATEARLAETQRHLLTEQLATVHAGLNTALQELAQLDSLRQDVTSLFQGDAPKVPSALQGLVQKALAETEQKIALHLQALSAQTVDDLLSAAADRLFVAPEAAARHAIREELSAVGSGVGADLASQIANLRAAIEALVPQVSAAAQGGQVSAVTPQIEALSVGLRQLPDDIGATLRQYLTQIEQRHSAPTQKAQADLDAVVAKVLDSTSQSLAGALEREQHRNEALEAKTAAHQQRIADLERELRGAMETAGAWRAANDAIRSSTSWRVSAPLRWLSPQRGAGPGASFAPTGGGRSVALFFWRLLPFGRNGRAAIKDWLFLTAPQVFAHTRTFHEWRASRAVPVPSPAASPSDAKAAPEPAPVPAPSTPQRMQDSARSRAVPAVIPAQATDYVAIRAEATPVQSTVRTIAFYLPQFHPIPENDAWWGKGFTEWTNVTRATPQYVGHYQPHLPDELGFYDLRVPAVQERQAELAKLYGVSAFCFYFYWFAGKRLLEQPILQWLENRNIDMPFCLCWANENWSRRWDGLDSELLIGQDHSPADDLAFIAYIAKYLRDPRYVRINGKPLLLVYRPSLLPDPRATAQRWRQWCRDNGVGEIHLTLTQSFDMLDPTEYGFDAAVEFPPNNMGPPDITDQVEKLNPDFSGTIYDYDFYVDRSANLPERPYTVFRGVFPSWDNEARRVGRGVSFHGATPAKFRRFVRHAAEAAVQTPNRDERIIFVNAWNEWAEGAHLEPDRRYGYAWLEALRQGLEDVPAAGTGRHLILVVHDAYRHGAQYLALNMARVFSRDLGFELDIVILGDGPMKADFAALGVVHDFAGKDPRGPLARQLARDLKAKGADRAICNTTVTGRFLETLSEEGVTCIALIHELPGVIAHYGLEAHLQAIWRRAELTVYPSAFVRDRIAPPADRPAIVRTQGLYKRNGARSAEERAAARERLRSHFNLPADTEIVISVAYGDRRKGIDLWPALGQLVMQARPSAVFLWAGEIEAKEADALAAAVKATGLADRFLFPGFQSQTDDFYAGADVYALLSREDPFPTVIMEALDVGVPVVAFDGAGGFSDLLRAGVGVLVPMDDLATFARGVVELLADKAARQTMGAKARDIVRKDFSFRRYCFDLARFVGADLDRVSVVVPNYNYARHLSDRFASALNQGFPIYELIVLDDRSTDDSVAVANALLAHLDVDWTLHVNDTNTGSPCRQWLSGAAMAKGEFVWIAEADDLTLPGFLRATLPAFRDPDVVMSYCQSQQMGGDGTILSPDYLDYVADIDAEKWRADHVAQGREEIRAVLAVRNTIPNVSACVFRREALVAAMQAHIEEIARYRIAGDWATYVRVLERGKIAFSSQALNLHRRHERSMTLGSFNEKLLHEILSMQRAVQDRYGASPRAAAIARTYAQQLYQQFGLATAAHPEVFANPAFVAYFANGRVAAE